MQNDMVQTHGTQPESSTVCIHSEEYLTPASPRADIVAWQSGGCRQRGESRAREVSYERMGAAQELYGAIMPHSLDLTLLGSGRIHLWQ